MVDVSSKGVTLRKAKAFAMVLMNPATFKAITSGKIKKGNVLETARLAGIMAAKETHKLIPLCHPIKITHIRIDIKPVPTNSVGVCLWHRGVPKCPLPIKPDVIEIYASVEAYDRTGVEMEALTAAAICGLTIYDMCKAIDRGMEITDIKLLEKSGGRSGIYKR